MAVSLTAWQGGSIALIFLTALVHKIRRQSSALLRHIWLVQAAAEHQVIMA